MELEAFWVCSVLWGIYGMSFVALDDGMDDSDEG